MSSFESLESLESLERDLKIEEPCNSGLFLALRGVFLNASTVL